MKKKVIIVISIIVLILVAVGSIFLLKDKENEVKLDELRQDKRLTLKLEEDIKNLENIIDTILNQERIKKIENKNEKINRVIDEIDHRYKGQYDLKQVQEIVIKKVG